MLLAVSWQIIQGRTVGGCAEHPWRDEEVRGSLEPCPDAEGSSELSLCFCYGVPLHPPVLVCVLCLQRCSPSCSFSCCCVLLIQLASFNTFCPAITS